MKHANKHANKLSVNLVRKSAVQKTVDDETLEAVIYPSCKRNVVINHREYFLQIPNILAVKIKLKRKPSAYDRIGNYYCGGPCCALSVYVTHNGKVYDLPFNQNIFAGGLCVCLDFELGHVYYKPEATLDELMNEFWWTEFSYYTERPVDYFGSFHDWQKMSSAEVLEKLDQGADRGSLDQFLQNLKKRANEANESLMKAKYLP